MPAQPLCCRYAAAASCHDTLPAPGASIRRQGGAMAYELRGQFLEACDCRVTCPCWFHEQPDDDECAGLVAWHVEWGRIDGVDVSGLTAVSVSHHGGHRAEGHARVALFLDERAGEEQRAALAAAFSGTLGGPLRELAEITRSVEQLEPARSTSRPTARRPVSSSATWPRPI